jgi:hypothetical protein
MISVTAQDRNRHAKQRTLLTMLLWQCGSLQYTAVVVKIPVQQQW